ncbi:MAG: hypothetical protein E7A86_36685, partial [Bradyrhizobium sp.]|nr:hypothetical protein [Bradyrhizobium sp.]
MGSFLGARLGRSGVQGDQAGDDTRLEGDEGDDLRQRDNRRRGPAGVEQRLQIGRTGIARMQDQEMRMTERRGETRAGRLARRCIGLVDGTGDGFMLQRTVGI